MRWLKVFALLLAVTVLVTLAHGAETEPNLHFDQPAVPKWTGAIPLGTGRLGATVFGRRKDERYQINESTLWGVGRMRLTIRRPTAISTTYGSLLLR